MFGCEHGAPLRDLASNTASVSVRCVGQVPPSFIDYVLSRDLADGVVLAGCAENSGHARHGMKWTEARLARTRDPHLRARVPADRLKVLWAGRLGRKKLGSLLQEFTRELDQMPAPQPRPEVRRMAKVEEFIRG